MRGRRLSLDKIREMETAAFFAAVRNGSAPSPDECEACEGSGECEACEGEGTVECSCPHCDDEHDRDCAACDGSGKCPECVGQGESTGALHPADLWTLRVLGAEVPALDS